MKISDNHYLYRLETQNEDGSIVDFQEVETVEPLRSVGDIHDELDLENNKQIKRIEEIVFTGDSSEYWYNDDVHTTDTHFVAYMENIDLYCHIEHHLCETDRNLFEFGDVHIDENKNFFCTSVESNGMNRIYISIAKSELAYTVYSHETLKEYFKDNPTTVWYVLRYPIEIPRLNAKGYVITHNGSTTIDVQPQTTGKVIPIVKATIEDTVIEMDSVPTMTINNTDEGNQITDLTFEGVTLVNNAKADNIKGTKEVSHTRYDFAPFYDGQTTINNTIEGGYVSAKLYGDTMINIAKTYGETDLLTATDDSAITDLLGDNTDGVIVADGTITEGRIYGNSEVIDEIILSVKNPTTIINNGAELSSVTLPYELNKLPNGVADYIDVVNGVYVQRVGKIVLNGSENWYLRTDLENSNCLVASIPDGEMYEPTDFDNTLCDKISYEQGNRNTTNIYTPFGAWVLSILKSSLSSQTLDGMKQWLSNNNITVLAQLKTPIYTPLTDEEKALLPLTVYAQGNIMMSSDELRPSKFEFRAKSNNRMQLDMLETGHYYLNASTGNVKLGNVDINVTEMPCIINVTDRTNNRLVVSGESYKFTIPMSDMIRDYYFDDHGSYTPNEYMWCCYSYYKVDGGEYIYYEPNTHNRVTWYREDYSYISTIYNPSEGKYFAKIPNEAVYMRFSEVYSDANTDLTFLINPITLSKLPSHRIPTTFTQGMKSSVDFGYWEGSKEAKGTSFRTNKVSDGSNVDSCNIYNGTGIVLNRVVLDGKIIEDELDISTGKYIKRIEKVIINGSENWTKNTGGTAFVNANSHYTTLSKRSSGYDCCSDKLKFRAYWSADEPRVWIDGRQGLVVHLPFGVSYNTTVLKQYLSENPIAVYYELETPEITYLDLPKNVLKTAQDATYSILWTTEGYLVPQVKPSLLSYPTTLSPNTQYTVFHNRKNYNGSVKTPMINLGGTEVAATGSRTVVTTPSTLAHNELQFIGGENTVEQVMVVHGDWTKEGKTVDYFEGLQSSVIGDKTLENLVGKPINIQSNRVTNSSNGGAVDYVSMDDILVGYGNKPKLPEVQVDTNIRTYGMTLQNLAVQYECIAEPNTYIRAAVYDGVLPVGTYIFFYNVIEPNSTTQDGGDERFTPYYTCQDGSTYYEGWETHNQTTGLKYWKFTATSPITVFRFWIANIDASCSANNFMLLQYQQGMENWNIPFFEGMKSVENPVYYSVGKNLFDIEKIANINNWVFDKITVEHPYSYYKFSLKPNTTYTFSRKSNVHTDEIFACFHSVYGVYNENGGVIHPTNDKVNRTTVNFTTDSNGTIFFNTYGMGSNFDTFISLIEEAQIEEGLTATSYEPYKENILSTPQGTELRGVGSYKDVIGWNDGIIRRRCIEFTITGEEGYNFHGFTENTNTIKCALAWESLGLKDKIPTSAQLICDKIPWMHSDQDTPHVYSNTSTPYSYNLWFFFDKTKFSTYTSQGINDYIKSIGGLTIVAPLADTQYEDVEITGEGNWKEFVLTGSSTWWDAAGEGDTTNGFSVWTTIQDFVNANNDNPLKYRIVKESELEYIDYFKTQNSTNFISFNFEQQIIINVKGCHSIEQVKTWLDEHPITILFQSTGNRLQNTTPNTDVLIFNHGTLYTTTDTHPSTFSDFSLKTTNRYTVKDFDKLKYTVLTEQPFYLNGIDYPSSSTGMTIIDITGIADSSIYSDDTMITVVQDDGNYYADGVLTQFKGTKTFTKEFIRTSNGTYDTGMTLLEPLELCSSVEGVRDIYNPITGTLVKRFHTFVIDDEFLDKYSWNYQEDTANNMWEIYIPNTASREILPAGKGGFSGYATPPFHYNSWGNIERICMTDNLYIKTYISNVPNKDVNSFLEYLKQYTPITVSYELETPQIIQATPTSTYISTRPENGNIVAQDIQIQAEYLNYDNEQSIISPRMLGDGDEIRWEQGSQCYVYENDNEYIPLTEYNELFGANLQAQEYTQYAESVDGADIEVGVALKEKAVYEQTYVKYEDNIVYPETMENIDETNGVEVDYICGATWQNPDDLSDIRHLGTLREDGQYDVTIRRSGDDEIRLLEGTTHISLDYDELPPSEFELTFFNSGGVEVGKYGDTSHTLEDCVLDSKLETGTVYGETMVNVFNYTPEEMATWRWSLKDSGGVAIWGGSGYMTKVWAQIQAGKTYTMIYVNAPSHYLGFYVVGTFIDGYSQTQGKYSVFTVKDDYVEGTNANFYLKSSQGFTDEELANIQIIVVEGDYTSYPMDIPYFKGMKSTVVNGFSSCGKNLFGDLLTRETSATRSTTFNYTDDEVTVSCTENAWLNVAFHDFKVKPSTKYILSFNITILDGNPYVVCGISGNGQSYTYYEFREISANTDRTHIVYELNTRPTDREVSIRFYGANDAGHGTVRYYNIQLEEGSAPTEYEPYKGTTYTLPTPITLCKIGDICDTFDVVSGVETRSIEKIVLDGTWQWTSYKDDFTTTPNHVFIELSSGQISHPTGKEFGILSPTTLNYWADIWNKANYVDDNKISIGMSPGIDSKCQLYIPKSLLGETVSFNSVRQYLNDNPIEVYYERKTPTTIQHSLIPSTTQTTQEPTFILPQPLRSVPNGICDRLYWDENKGHYCIEKRVDVLNLDGTENWSTANSQDSATTIFFQTSINSVFNTSRSAYGETIYSDKFKYGYVDSTSNEEIRLNGNFLQIRINKNRLETLDVSGFKKWLRQNNTILYYLPSASEIIDLPHLNEKVELLTQPNIYPIGYKAVHEKANPEIGLTIPYKQLNMPTQPVNLNFVMDIADYVLTWDDVKEARQYNIILNDEVIATVKEPQDNTGEEMYGYILVEANNEIGDSVSKELYIKTVPNAPAQLTVAHNPSTDYYDFEISFIDKSAIADYYTVQYRVDGGEWIINNIENDKLAIGDKKLWSFSVYEIKESIEVWATATNDVGTNDILPSAIYYMSPTPQWTYRMNSKEVFLCWMDNSPYDVKYKLRYSYLSNGQYQYAYFEGDKEEIGKLYEAVVPLAENDEVAIALCIVSERENLYCKPVKASKELDPNIVPPLNFNYRWLARGLVEFYWQDQYDVDVEYEYILETMKGSESVWTQVNETITSTDVEGTGTVYRVEYQLEDLEQIRMKVRMKWAMNETQWTETLTTVFIPVEGNPPTYIRRTQTAEGLLVEWEAQAYIDSYHIYVIDNTTKEVLQHLETQDNNIIVDLDYSNSIELAIYEISRFSGGIESDPTDSMVFTPTMSETTMLQNIYQPCVEEHSIEVSTVQKGSKQPYVIHDVSYTPNVESESDLQVNVSTPFIISYHPTEIDVHQVGSKAIADMDLKIKTLDTRTEETVEVMTFERITDTYDMNFQVYTPSVMSYPITLEVSKVRIVCLGDSLTSGHPFYWAETGTGMVEASYPYQLSRRLKNQYEVINSGYG